MKRIVTWMLIMLVSIPFYANGVAIEGIYYLLNSENHTATVTYPNETAPSWSGTTSTYSGTVNIPGSVEYEGSTYTVTAIGESAFIGTTLTAITLPNTITTIGRTAFMNHRGITALELPGLQSIGNEAFRWCPTLQKVVLPECINSLGIILFQRCVNLKEIHFPQSLTALPYACLQACSALENVTLPPSITFIPQECFNACVSLQSVSLPVGVSSIGLRAFKGTESLEKIYIPKNVVSLDDELLEGFPQDPYTGGAVPQYTGISKLKSVFIDCVTPPACTGADKNPFLRVNKNKVRLFVPEESVEIYKSIPAYADHFKGIYAFGAEVTNVMDITDSSALITWFPYPEVVLYTLDVYTAGMPVVQVLVDGEGNILSSQRFMPSVLTQKQDTTNSSTDYFVVSLDDLTPGTDYNYTINGTNDNTEQIYHATGSFTTTDTEGLPSLYGIDRRNIRKILRDGHIFILCGDNLYSLTGQEIK